MENKINIAELLKDCPKGMELDCTMYENVEFDYIEQNSELTYPIHCLMKINGGYNTLVFTRNGCNDRHPNAKCVIFPKGKTTWEGFQRPFKDGDILATDLGSVFFLNMRLNTDEYYGCYIGIGGDGSFHICEPFAYKECCGLATEEEKQKLFDAIKANGYKWNEKTKTLEKLPKFKVGDRVVKKDGISVPILITGVGDEFYYSNTENSVGLLPIAEQDDWELVPNKFDITTLVPLESKVLVRNVGVWLPAFWGYYSKEYKYPFVVDGGNTFAQCIPYEGNEYLLGTTNDCDNYYKTW